MSANNLKWIVFSLVVAAIGFIIVDPYYAHLFSILCVYAVLAVSFRFTMLVGEINLAHASFFGIGAYVSAALTMQFGVPFVGALLLSGLIAALISMVFGSIAFRVKGAYFLLLSFAFAEMVRLFFQNVWTDVLGGVNGIAGIPFPMEKYYGFIAILTLLLLYALYRLEKANFGKILIAIRNSDDLSRSIGINSMKYKVLALVISSFIAGMSGSIFAHFNTVISPQDFSFHLSIIILSFVIIGGRNNFVGPIVGVILLTFVTEYIRGFGSFETLAYGLAIILAMLFLPNGLVGTLRSPNLQRAKKAKVDRQKEAKA
ncbi:branched-chain amino acid ABC transporter permease [Neobacillus sp. 114]|uniref:branched-chain amino acid ABC transporter permease n=1 Tax=Neobacillus sp. 114 TaxID=3048535 RepID=UPI0024C2ED53|nr:branched-chain amino acid ABC transporter permease [Neobacillus sp. 114]